MAVKSGTSGLPQPDDDPSPPFVGALLRLCWQRVKTHLYEAVRLQGFDDLQETHFAVFSYPLPDDVRLSQLARQHRMSRQAANYLVGQLEELGYLERRPAPGSTRRHIFLTERGMLVAQTIYAALRELQQRWADEVGPERFGDFTSVLAILSQDAPNP
jgi:DNA-binding MarR family transcriptional regulator